jgi:hypothetical protein
VAQFERRAPARRVRLDRRCPRHDGFAVRQGGGARTSCGRYVIPAARGHRGSNANARLSALGTRTRSVESACCHRSTAGSRAARTCRRPRGHEPRPRPHADLVRVVPSRYFLREPPPTTTAGKENLRPRLWGWWARCRAVTSVGGCGLAFRLRVINSGDGGGVL